MEQRVSIVTLGVLDLERSRRFYELLGWRQSRQAHQILFSFRLEESRWRCIPELSLRKTRIFPRKEAASAA